MIFASVKIIIKKYYYNNVIHTPIDSIPATWFISIKKIIELSLIACLASILRYVLNLTSKLMQYTVAFFLTIIFNIKH